jgi:hypothetical protein
VAGWGGRGGEARGGERERERAMMGLAAAAAAGCWTCIAAADQAQSNPGRGWRRMGSCPARIIGRVL